MDIILQMFMNVAFVLVISQVKVPFIDVGYVLRKIEVIP